MAAGRCVMSMTRNPRTRPRRTTRSATYIGIGTTLFDEMVRDGRMPKPKKINGLRRWDRYALDLAYDALPDSEENEWDRE